MHAPELPEISPDLRARLRDDIRRRGILVPVLLAHDGECLDGRLRLEIAEELGLTPASIPKVVIGKLDPSERHDIRVALNLYRRQLSRAQVRELVAWELLRFPHASDRSTGLRIGVDHKTVAVVRRSLNAGEEIPHVHSRDGADGKFYRKPVVYTTSNAQAVEAQELLGELGDFAPNGPMNVKKLRRIASARERADHLTKVSRGGPTPSGDYRIHNADFRAIDRLIAPGSVDLALCDSPWGGEFAPLRKPFAEAIYRVLHPDGIFACYTGVAHLAEFLDAFRDAGLKYEWTLVGRRQVSSVRQRNLLINRWVPIVICRKGRFRTVMPMNDVIESSEHDKTLHAWQQPVEEAATLIRALSRPGALVCDLVVGSGSTTVATVVAGERRRFVGCEADAGLAKAARARVAEAVKGAKGKGVAKLARE